MAFSFGANTSKPAFSFGNTSTATSAPSGFTGFGAATTSTSVFGAPTSTVAPFGSIGTAATTTTPSLFGAGGLGAATSKPSIGFGNTSFGSTFGTNTGFGTGNTFGSTAPTFGSTAPAFGSTAPTFGSTAPTFGSTAPSFGTNTFGTGNTFGSTFGAKPATTGLNFGGALGQTNTLGLQTQQPQQQGPASAHEALVAAVFNCNVFGDERDQVLAKWNLIQAQWGTGQAYYSRNAPPLELNEQNPLCRFKAVGYSRLGGKEDKEGHVSMVFNKPEADIKNNQQQMITSLAGVLGNKPNLAVNIDSIQAIAGNKTQMVIYVVDKNALGSRVAASELCAFLQNAKAALSAGGCVSLAPATRPDKHALDLYLNTAPPGMDMRMWKQAQTDNPDSENYIPVPIIGFSEIKFRSQCQSQQAALQAGFLKKANEQLNELRSKRAAAAAKLSQLAAKHHALKHTLLQVISRQEVIGRVGAALSPEEEASRARLQELSSQLAAPPLNNGRLNELLCAVRLQRSASAGGSHERYHLDPGAQEDVKQFLALQQRGMAHLLDTARKDLAALNVIADGMSRLVHA